MVAFTGFTFWKAPTGGPVSLGYKNSTQLNQLKMLSTLVFAASAFAAVTPPTCTLDGLAKCPLNNISILVGPKGISNPDKNGFPIWVDPIWKFGKFQINKYCAKEPAGHIMKNIWKPYCQLSNGDYVLCIPYNQYQNTKFQNVVEHIKKCNDVTVPRTK
jgi:hypothetical protein